MLRTILNTFNLLLSLGAFYLGGLMFLKKGIFSAFPQEWIGQMPFSSWASLALFGIIIFGIGNAVAFAYGFIKKNKKVFILSIGMGSLLLLCAALPIVLLGEWYLPTAYFFILSSIQLVLGLVGLVAEKLQNEDELKSH